MPDMMPGPGGAPGAPPMPQGSTAPATVPPRSDGLHERGRVGMSMVIKNLEKYIGMLGSGTEEGQAALKALVLLSKHFGQASGDLTRQEIKLSGEQAAPVATPQNPQAFQQMIRQMNAGRGIGGGPPAGAPTPSPTPALQMAGAPA